MQGGHKVTQAGKAGPGLLCLPNASSCWGATGFISQPHLQSARREVP